MSVKAATKITGLILGFVIAWFFGAHIGKTRGIGIPFVGWRKEFSIGIYSGKSPFDVRPAENVASPVMSARDVNDVPAGFVADPFMVEDGRTWYMFFEVWNNRTNQGDIAVAVSDDLSKWTYKQIVLDEPFHLSYPYVFKWDNEYYMIPESSRAYSIRLYKAVDFPYKWSFVSKLITGNFVDSSIFRYDGRWWMFASDGDSVLRLFYADVLTGPWIEHPKSPIVLWDARIARSAGRVIIYDGKPIRYTQDCNQVYGLAVQAFRITELTVENYQEEKASVNPVLKGSGSGWNAQRMHQIDAHWVADDRWVACVDGYVEKLAFGLKF
jgi:hypothetical protein